MNKRIIAALAVIALLFTAGVTSSSAQTAGVSALEQVGYMLKHTFAFSLNGDGSVLTLRNRAASSDMITVTAAAPDDVVLQSVLGDVSSLSKQKQEAFRGILMFVNTSLPIGTITLENSGRVALEHHVNPAYLSPQGMTDVVNRFSSEAARQRKQIFS